MDLFPERNLVCFVLYNTFSADECRFLIDSIETIGRGSVFEDQSYFRLSTLGFNKLRYGENYRTNTR